MQAKPGVVDQLNAVLGAQLTLSNQYLLHAEVARRWGFQRLQEELHRLHDVELEEGKRILARILYLEGAGNIQRSGSISTGDDAAQNLEIALQQERDAVNILIGAIRHCARVEDYTTLHMLEELIAAVEGRVDWLERQLEAIRRVGLAPYLAEQMS